MRKTSARELAILWGDLGISPGDTLLCHSYLPSLGLLDPGPGIVIDTLLAAVGPAGTLVVPTFTYSWFKGEPFDVQNSPGTVGLLGELLRNRAGALRSKDPCFSNAAIGARSAELARRDVPNSFGAGSLYDKLLSADAKALLIGLDFRALPLFMHIERMHGVNYRYEKKFTGVILDNGQRIESDMIHFVRDERRNPETDRSRISSELDNCPDCKLVGYGYGEHRCIRMRVIVEKALAQLESNHYFLLKQPV